MRITKIGKIKLVWEDCGHGYFPTIYWDDKSVSFYIIRTINDSISILGLPNQNVDAEYNNVLYKKTLPGISKGLINIDLKYVYNEVGTASAVLMLQWADKELPIAVLNHTMLWFGPEEYYKF